ncbi:acetyltransferase [Undibacterium luofuense]|uniref:Acetyltransferase n=1 Tax=Undibacterium luofuense TaxID=2828733 RepID=A0A941DJH2_9BURK|nr:acetyltransferase [Undibacterium luofuense]MBR7781169.1 acetyltransferase [Undibacterium luofuense]
MKQIVVVGGGGMAREVIALMNPVIQSGQVRIRGVIDDTLPLGEDFFPGYPYPVLGNIATFKPQESDLLLLAIGDPAARLKLGRELSTRGCRFFSFIHPTAIVAPDAKLGAGVVIYPYSLVSANTRLGDFVLINVHSGAGHDVVIGDGSVICAHVDLTGFVQVGEAVLIGSHASVLPKVRIGDCAKIGAGSIVVRSVRAHATVFAQPARTLKQAEE